MILIIILMKKSSLSVAIKQEIGRLFASFKIIFRLYATETWRTHVCSPFVLPVGLFHFADPRRSLWIEGRFRGITMDTLPNHGAYVCTGRRFLDNPPTRDRIRTYIYIYRYIQFAEFAQPTAIGTGFAYDRQMFTPTGSGVTPKARSSLAESRLPFVPPSIATRVRYFASTRKERILSAVKR